jgi:hypothetical protein
MVSQAEEAYCLPSKKPDQIKTTLELEKDIIALFEESIEKMKALRVAYAGTGDESQL